MLSSCLLVDVSGCACTCSLLYSISLPPGSDVSTQTQLVSALCTKPSDLAMDLELRFPNKRATSLLGGKETEYSTRDSYILRVVLFYWTRFVKTRHV